MPQASSRAEPNASPIARWRIWLLRGGYLLLTLGMGIQILPIMINHDPANLDEGIVNSMLFAMVVLCALGLRDPLKLLPILFWEMIWKTAWLLTVALPTLQTETMDESTASVASACSLVVIVYLVVPWDYVYRTYIAQHRLA